MVTPVVVTRELAFQVKFYDRTMRSRVALERHFETLRERGVGDPFLAGILERYVSIEDDLEKEVTRIVQGHPVWTEWAHAVRGCGALALGKIMGRSYRFYPGIKRLPEDKRRPCNARAAGGRCGREDVHLHGIEQFETASQLRAHAGLAPGQRLKKGELATWDQPLKSACWLMGRNLRLAVRHDYFLREDGRGPFESLRETLAALNIAAELQDKQWSALPERIQDQIERRLRDQGKAREFYLRQKEVVRAQWEQEYGPIGKKKKKDQLGDLDIDRRAMHKMMQVFMVMLWVVWRRTEGLPVRPSYAAEKLGHHDMQPEEWME